MPVAVKAAHAERATVAGAIRTDFILSAMIMVTSLEEVIDEPIASRAIVLIVVAVLIVVSVLITAIVYGVVTLIVRMDDAGLALVQRD